MHVCSHKLSGKLNKGRAVLPTLGSYMKSDCLDLSAPRVQSPQRVHNVIGGSCNGPQPDAQLGAQLGAQMSSIVSSGSYVLCDFPVSPVQMLPWLVGDLKVLSQDFNWDLFQVKKYWYYDWSSGFYGRWVVSPWARPFPSLGLLIFSMEARKLLAWVWCYANPVFQRRGKKWGTEHRPEPNTLHTQACSILTMAPWGGRCLRWSRTNAPLFC